MASPVPDSLCIPQPFKKTGKVHIPSAPSDPALSAPSFLYAPNLRLKCAQFPERQLYDWHMFLCLRRAGPGTPSLAPVSAGRRLSVSTLPAGVRARAQPVLQLELSLWPSATSLLSFPRPSSRQKTLTFATHFCTEARPTSDTPSTIPRN